MYNFTFLFLTFLLILENFIFNMFSLILSHASIQTHIYFVILPILFLVPNKFLNHSE